MPTTDSLKRLGGGRWETRDGRFQIEPQSGTWVIVDTAQTNEFGLPLVRGPYPSLTAAKLAIETARDEGPVTSPLAERLEVAANAVPEREPTALTSKRMDKVKAEPTKPGADRPDAVRPEAERPEADEAASAEPEAAPQPAPEPLWLRQLKPISRQRARDLIEQLESLGFDDAEAIARSEIADGAPAIVRAAIRRQVERATKGSPSVDAAVAVAMDVLMSGEDEELGVGWGLVDDRGRPIERLD